jgi:multicomponent Na+:H+ antiporter subunit C
MNVLMSIVVGGLFAAGTYLMLRRNVTRLVIGLALLGHAANLLLLMAGGLYGGHPPIIAPGGLVPPQPYADPLVQAMVLTAIVIGLAIQAFALVLIRQLVGQTRTPDLDAARTSEQMSQEAVA